MAIITDGMAEASGKPHGRGTGLGHRIRAAAESTARLAGQGLRYPFRYRRLKELRARKKQIASQLRPATPFDGNAKASQPFCIDFLALERKGFIGRPFIRRRLARDMRAMRHRLLNRMHAFQLDDAASGDLRETIVMVTSCWSGEGKTFTAVNLALSLVLEDTVDVLLLDGDIIRPSLDKMFNINPQRGLVDFLSGSGENLAPYLWRAENGRLTILPAGQIAKAPRALFRGQAMSRFIHDVSNRYPERIVIIDTPPLLGGGEAPVLANHADHILLVVECGRASQSAVEDALDLLTTHENVSLVLNRCNEGDRLTSGASDRYGYYRQQSDFISASLSAGDIR